MSKIAVVYKSKYGTTKRYAEWIANELGAGLFDASHVKPAQLADFDTVIFGGWVFASTISGLKTVIKTSCKHLVVFSVGLGDPETADYTGMLKSAASSGLPSAAKVFHLRGGVDYGKLGVLHKGMFGMVRSAAKKKDESQRSSEEKAILETYGGKVDYTDKSAIEPIIDYIRGLC
jgi:hypothetical protein